MTPCSNGHIEFTSRREMRTPVTFGAIAMVALAEGVALPAMIVMVTVSFLVTMGDLTGLHPLCYIYYATPN